jgi:hypothetical protein
MGEAAVGEFVDHLSNDRRQASRQVAPQVSQGGKARRFTRTMNRLGQAGTPLLGLFGRE